ncbi:MAG: hypothetical protein JXB49_29870 [Bacteroidales bacterium]|nr:hypothetical protein [Bacteroidales bacterium]
MKKKSEATKPIEKDKGKNIQLDKNPSEGLFNEPCHSPQKEALEVFRPDTSNAW